MDGKKLYETMLARMPPSRNAKPAAEAWNLDTALEATPVGRALKEQLEPEQREKLKSVTGIPLLDKQ